MALRGVVLGLIEEAFYVVAVKRSDINFSAVTFRTRNVFIVPKSAFRKSFINYELLSAF